MDMTFKRINGPITEVVFGTKDVVLNRACILAHTGDSYFVAVFNDTANRNTPKAIHVVFPNHPMR
ncbi:hypothetical protein N7527_005861 [Penicillium freii]|nr:hypothetical protein N7527_005861 [Penicillium freii]